MNVFCYECGKFVAEIRDASIRHGTVYMCKTCYEPEPAPNNNSKVEDSELFKILFGGKK